MYKMMRFLAPRTKSFMKTDLVEIEVQIHDNLRLLSEALQAGRLEMLFALRKYLKEIKNNDLGRKA